jgi:hypothetical protein
VLPSCAVHRSAALVLAMAGVAHADNPRDVFGFKPKPQEQPLDCSDGLTFGCAQATDPLSDSVPYALSTWLPASYLLSLPVADATHDEVADYALGASRDEAGVTFAGANGLENRWTIDGAPADNVRTGGVDTRVPLTFLDGILVTAGGFAAHDRTSTGGMIDARLKRGTEQHELDVHVWAGYNGVPRHTPITLASYQLRRGIVDPGPGASASIVATGPLGAHLGGSTWYVAGIAPAVATTHFKFSAASVVDFDQDGHPDGLPGFVTTAPIEDTETSATTWAVPLLARLGLDRGVHHVELTLVGSAGSAARYLFNSTLQAGGVDATNVVADGIATWRGNWTDTHARVQAAWHRSMHMESARDPAAAGIPQLLTAYVPTTLPDDPVLAQKCADNVATDPYPNLVNCPVPFGWFASGGAGPLVDLTGDRPSLTGDIAHRFGTNVVRAGATGEDSRLVTESRFTGGQQLRSLFPGEMSQRRFVDADLVCPEDPTKSCPYVDRSVLAYRTRYTAAYVEDTWHAAPDIQVDGGLRWELMWVGPALHFSNELAPRIGWTWDPLGKGTSRVWTSMGRSYAMLPTGLGSTILRRDRTADDITFGGAMSRFVDTGAPLVVAPGIEPLAQDELTAGVDLAVRRTFRLTGWIQGRWLWRGLETTPQGFDNPGHAGGVPASRETTLLALELSTSPTANLVLRTGYMYGRTVGSWTGAFDPRDGAALYNSPDFDVISTNQLGPLPTELGHHVYIEGQRNGHIAGIAVAVATRFTLASGRPRDALGDSDIGIIYLIPRGEAGNGPMTTQANVRLAATWHHVDITLDVINVFDHRDTTALDQVYAGGSIHPIDGGSLEDLVFLKTENGDPAPRRTAYNAGTAFQPPFAAVLGIHEAF